jgi:hypothetical protein
MAVSKRVTYRDLVRLTGNKVSLARHIFSNLPPEGRFSIDEDRWNEAMFRVGIASLSWAEEHQQEWAQWISAAMPEVAAEYNRLGETKP